MVTVAPASARVLLVEGDSAARNVLSRILENGQYVTQPALNPQDALCKLRASAFDVVLFDVDEFGIEALQSLCTALKTEQHAAFIAMVGEAAGKAACGNGTVAQLTRPFDAATLLALVHRSVLSNGQNGSTSDQVRSRATLPAEAGMIGQSPAIMRLWEFVRLVAPTRASVLITGETGTGKELVARGVHALSPRAQGRFVAVHCSALPETLLESELFGHTRGSFTGAIANRAGMIEEAKGGTLFLDEISTISPSIQVKLLRVLQERKIQRVGSDRPIPVDFRLVAATNVDLGQEVKARRFREDLFYRLNVFPIEVPPLRARQQDIPLLVNHFLKRFTREHGLGAPRIGPETLTRLLAYQWPGNVRELENFIERGVIMSAHKRELVFDPPGDPSSGRALLRYGRAHDWSLARLEREYILDVVAACDGYRGRAAGMLGIDRRTLYRKLKEYGAGELASPSGADSDCGGAEL